MMMTQEENKRFERQTRFDKQRLAKESHGVGLMECEEDVSGSVKGDGG